MEQTQCFETSAIKHHTPENNQKGYTRQIILYLYTVQIRTTKGRGRAIPIQVQSDREVSRTLRLPDFMTIGI
jgi:hypothetical protein